MRISGVLLPVSSLNSPYGIGGFGKEAYRFADFLEKAGQRLWQLLPLSPVGVGASPYSSCSAFAGNPYYIDPELLLEDGLLERKDLEPLRAARTGRVNYEFAENTRYPMLRKACKAFYEGSPVPGFQTPYPDDYYTFLFLNEGWLKDYTLFRAAKKEYNGLPWQQWPESVRARKPEALQLLAQKQKEEIEFWTFVEYEFWKQWKALKKYVNQKGIQILGDMPFYVSADSADAWAGGSLFEIDEQGASTRVAGCPPDYFSEEGQLWGNPLYNWQYHKDTGYEWWCSRLRRNLQLYDLVRIDHFRAFDTYWAIPAEAESAKEGSWQQGPGMEFFNTVRQKLGGLPLVAEDLGDLFDSVRNLLKASGLPGMKVLQFAFSYPGNEYLPHNHVQNSIAYTGTHDNNTLVGWLKQDISEKDKEYALQYFGGIQEEELPAAVLRCALGSVADTCIIPLQDWLGLDGESRMNVPGVVGANWAWRAEEHCLTDALAEHMRTLCAVYARCAPPET